MKFEEIHIKDFKLLKDFDAYPQGSSMILYGENAVGKSTVIQFLRIITGEKSQIPPNAYGEGHVLVDKDGVRYKMHLKLVDGKDTITLTSETGVKNKTKSYLASFTGAKPFNINALVELSKTEAKRRDQIELLKDLLSNEEKQIIVFLEEEIKQCERDFTEANRVVRQLKGSLEHASAKPVAKPADTADLLVQMKEATDHNNKVDSANQAWRIHTEKISSIDYQIMKLQEERAEIEEKKIRAEKFLSKNNNLLFFI